jgi:hypothetical protein
VRLPYKETRLKTPKVRLPGESESQSNLPSLTGPEPMAAVSAEKKEGNNDVIYGVVKVKEDLEFGGPVGVTALMIWSHLNLIYFWYFLPMTFIFLFSSYHNDLINI